MKESKEMNLSRNIAKATAITLIITIAFMALMMPVPVNAQAEVPVS